MRCILALAATYLLAVSTAAAQHPIPFGVKLLTVDANEGCDVGDLDGDGKLDVVAGRNWFRNGDWIPRPVRSIADWNGYVESNGDFLYDVDDDGRLDVIAGSFLPSEVYWYRNPGVEGLTQGVMWSKQLLVDTKLSQNEASELRDLDDDGIPEWITNSWNKNNPLIVWKFKKSEPEKKGDLRFTLEPHLVGKSANGHGIGFGDLNNDGRDDILVGSGWYERPAGDPWATTWKYHPDWDRPLSCPVLVRDLDHDGRNDVIWGNPHDFGIFFWKGKESNQPGAFAYDEILVDRSFSQPHCLAFADLDGDGQDELITGKRVRAHNGNDPGGREPPVVCYFTWNLQSNSFTRHDISRGTVGIGLQIRTADIDDDGDIDIVVAGKDGTEILFNERNPRTESR